ncbi:ATP-binding protein [Actinomadura decatromicini]|uniref:ATP-binding protein n=1 Tax=Actinomadura decatromicini TaxID=2604572 RepID=A0A5D3FWI0_9ACTN|nr:ATP-binding protein [Actinomadura decatromicini]TYK52339.1 ATP-binding protein [Actinomadura decatromicini]
MKTFTSPMKGVTLSCSPEEVSRARRAIRVMLTERFSQNVVEVIEQCTSETVTNAIVHSASKDNGGKVLLLVIELWDRIRVEVIDGGSAHSTPRITEPGTQYPEHGRGLFLVNALASAWGSYVDETGGNVWFEVETSK